LLSFIAIAPISTWFLGAILKWSSDPAISNHDLLSFFFSLQGFMLVVVSATVAFAILFLEVGGLALIALTIMRGCETSSWRTLLFLLSRFPRLCGLGLIQFLVVAAIATAGLAAAATASILFLSGGDFYYYLRIKPPEFWLVAAVSGAAFLLAVVVLAILAIRWIYSLPLLLIENCRAREAMARSAEMTRVTGRWMIAGRILATTGAVIILLGLASVLHGAIDWALMVGAGEDIDLVIAGTGLSLVFGLVLGTAAGFLASLTFAGLLADLYQQARPHIELPVAVTSDERWIVKAKGSRPGLIITGSAGSLAVLAAMVTISLTEQLDLSRTVKITAHRGASKAAPENTIAALRRAVRAGADYAEIDVQRTSDGVVVLLHDTDLRRVAGSNANIWDLTLDQVRQLDVGSWFSPEFAGERIPTLSEAIAAVGGEMRLNIELKVNGHDKGLAAGVAQVLAEADCDKDCVVSSLDYNVIREIAEHSPDLRRGLIVTASLGDISRLKVDFLAVNAGRVTRDLIDRARNAGMEVHVWTVNDPDRMLTMIHMGVDNILTSKPDALSELLSVRAEMSEAEKTLLLLADLAPGPLLRHPLTREDSVP
jgi:glycerophosphoryl diester phosphodiesterase